MADLRRNLERQMLVSQVQRVEILDKISITDEEAQAFYEAHRQEFTTPGGGHAARDPPRGAGQRPRCQRCGRRRRREQADDIRKRLLGGEPFPRLAGEFSVAASKANGGLIGPLKSEELAPALQRSPCENAGRRYHRADSHAARLSNPQVGIADRSQGPLVRRGARGHRQQDWRAEAARRAREVPRIVCEDRRRSRGATTS